MDIGKNMILFLGEGEEKGRIHFLFLTLSLLYSFLECFHFFLILSA
jgi:hypothetical protein